MTLLKFNQPAPKFINGWMENILNEFSAPLEKNLNAISFKPSVNIKETPEAYQLELSAPGRTKEDIKISVDKNLLTISYEKTNEQKDEKYIMREFELHPFNRTFTLDDKIESDNIRAKYENGLLSLELPKKAEAKVIAKEITVE
jgi:HSP20 family protein